jgi:prepilin peptidase CpaA
MDRTISISVIAVIVALMAAVFDVRERRIPNMLTYPGFILGIVLHASFWGWKGSLSAVLGAVFFGGLFLVFYVVRAMGAGDVKLAAALGCLVGTPASLNLMAATAAAGGALALFYMVRAQRVRQTFRNTFSVLVFHGHFGLQAHPTVNLENPQALRMPYGLAFAAGAALWFLSSSPWR